MFVESSEMQTAISRLTSAYIASHIILTALTTQDCRHFALDNHVEADFQQSCSHECVFSCDDFQGMKNVLQEVRLGIEGSCWILYSAEQWEDLLYDFDRHLEVESAHYSFDKLS